MRLTQAMKKKKKKRDDVESVDNESTMSTSSNLEPFANDNLGIVLHQKWVAVGKRGLKLVMLFWNAEVCAALLIDCLAAHKSFLSL